MKSEIRLLKEVCNFRGFWEISYGESGDILEKKGYKFGGIGMLWSLLVLFVIPTFLDLEATPHHGAWDWLAVAA